MIFVDATLDPSRFDASPQRLAMLEGAIHALGHAFPELHFERIEGALACNAQAAVLGGRREVRLYDGLAFHPAIGEDGILFTLLHEAGHHLAGGARLPWDPRLACECVADHWAATQGAEALGRERPGFSLARGLAELDVVLAERAAVEDEGDSAAPGEVCFALSRAARRRALLAKLPVLTLDCPLARLVIMRISGNGGSHGDGVR